MSGDSGDKPKIIVDEDWKSRVQAEKEKAAKASSSPTPEEAKPAPKPESKPAAAKPESKPEPQEIPPASFPLLVQMLATPAMMDLEESGAAREKGESSDESLARAKHFIDLLAVLEEKTKGNLSPEETRWMSGMLHQLRMFFVQASK